MIREVLTSKGSKAITSDRWHVVHSRFIKAEIRAPFVRGIISEQANRALCDKVAEELRARLAIENGDLPEDERDEVFVRKPNFKSLKSVRRRTADRD